MIRCRLHHLEARCRQRGYTLQQVRPCIVSQDGDRLVVDETHPAYPRAKPGLGDMVATGLSAVGITKERVQAVASKVGIKDCGCAKRQAALNRLGEKLGLPPGQAS
jgi:hypothetical protein